MHESFTERPGLVQHGGVFLAEVGVYLQGFLQGIHGISPGLNPVAGPRRNANLEQEQESANRMDVSRVWIQCQGLNCCRQAMLQIRREGAAHRNTPFGSPLVDLGEDAICLLRARIR